MGGFEAWRKQTGLTWLVSSGAILLATVDLMRDRQLPAISFLLVGALCAAIATVKIREVRLAVKRVDDDRAIASIVDQLAHRSTGRRQQERL